MDYLTLNEWGDLNPELVGKNLQLSELPVLKLNPILLTLYHKKYLTKCSLFVFLKSIQDSHHTWHRSIIDDLKDRGVKSKSVGGGEESNELFEWITNESYIINDYLLRPFQMWGTPLTQSTPTSVIIQDLGQGEITLEWNSWWFSPGLFVVELGTSKYQFINWMAVMPLDGGK